MSIEVQIAELEKQRTALLQKLQAAQEFWAEVELTLTVNGVNAVEDLPIGARQAIKEMATSLPSEPEIERGFARLEAMEGELAALMAQVSREHKAA